MGLLYASLQPSPMQGDDMLSSGRWASDVERQMTSLSGQCRNHEEKLQELTALLQQLHTRVDRINVNGAGTLALVREVVGQHLKDTGALGPSGTQVTSQAT